MQKRIIRRPLVSCETLPECWHPVIRRVYANRGIRRAEDLDYSLNHLQSWTDLKGIEAACTLLSNALHQQQRLLIIGDFDADGATSTAVAVLGLRALGARQVDFLVPSRFTDGYGLTPEIVAVAARSRPDLLITVDNGIANVAGVAAAKHRGIRVLVTDHHLPGRELPNADAIVNPNQPDDHFASKALAGVGVMFYVLMALRARLREDRWFGPSRPEPNLADLLDLVALGTIADVVPLDYNNRILVHQGLARIRAGRCRPGLRALVEVAGRDMQRLTTSDLGFSLGPRLNAAGRISDMSLGIDCLLTDDSEQAQSLARQLDVLNRQRREIEATMHEQALALTDELPTNDAALPSGVCLFDETWHQGVIGIVASRVKESVHRPVIAFALATAQELKGSARSIPGVHIRDVLDTVATAHPGLITKFGGHAMAAGISIKRTHYAEFAKAFAEAVDRHVHPEALQGIVYSDGELQAHDIGLALAADLRRAGPWGQAFSEPIFDGSFELLAQRLIGTNHLKLMVRAHPKTEPVEAMLFNARMQRAGKPGQAINFAYRLNINDYGGRQSPQLVIEHVLPQTSRIV